MDKQLVLENILDVLCTATNRSITIILPEKKKEQIPYLKKEIIKTLNLIKEAAW